MYKHTFYTQLVCVRRTRVLPKNEVTVSGGKTILYVLLTVVQNSLDLLPVLKRLVVPREFNDPKLGNHSHTYSVL